MNFKLQISCLYGKTHSEPAKLKASIIAILQFTSEHGTCNFNRVKPDRNNPKWVK